MKNRSWGSLLATALLAFHLPAAAEDIDLFMQPPPSATDLPNVLILLDNTANWNTAFTNEIAALVSAVNGLPVNASGAAKFRLGLMLFTETGGGNSGDDGGYVRAAVRDLSSANKTKYMALLSSLDRIADASNSGKLGKTMTDAFRYFSGAAPYTGNNKVKTDYTGNISGTAASNAIYALPGNALTGKGGSPYLSPLVTGSCAKSFIIYISNGAAQDSNADIAAATTELGNAATAAGIANATTAIPISPSGSQTNVGDEWAKFLHKSNLGIVTYTLDVDKVTTGQGPGWTALLKSMAGVSSGKYFDVSSSANSGAEIAAALNTIFSEIQSVNSVFASVSLPVSVNTEGTFLNQVFIGMFRPDAETLPRWSGNLKQYKLGRVGNDLRQLDANDNPAINNLTGFIAECARSFWTPATTDTYWSFRPQGNCLAVANSDISNYPDGNIVEKGAQAYRLRSTTTRTVKTCSAAAFGCSELVDFNNTNVTQANLGAASTTERDALINWARGLDTNDENINAVTTTEMRSTAHGDVVHSRPVALNFSASDTSPQVVVFYGANDGVLRAVNGNRSTNIGTVPAGSELWSFVPPEFDAQFKRLRDNSTLVSFFASEVTPVLPKPYAMDGPLTAFQNADRTSTWIYATMRRGGRVVYAFDVSNIASNPGSPTLKWKIGCPNQGDDTGCTTGFSGIGQTWSSLKPLKAQGYGSGTSPMLIMGGGYDTCEDADPHTCTSTTKGNHVYVLDADTGERLVTLDTDRAVVGDVFVINDATSGLAKWAYVADLGGNIYRIRGSSATSPFGSTAPSSWGITKIASLGANRKFMFMPDIVDDGDTFALLVGSGDREKPLTGFTSAYAVSNYFFLVRDKPTDAAWLSSENANCGSNVMCLDSLLPILTTDTPSASDLGTKKGWYLGLSPHEQVVTSAITVFGITTFSTHVPAVPVVGSCASTLGTASVFNVSYKNAAAAGSTSGENIRSQVISGGGLPPSPVAGQVRLDDGTLVPFLIGGNPDSPLEGSLPTRPAFATQPKGKAYWYIQK